MSFQKSCAHCGTALSADAPDGAICAECSAAAESDPTLAAPEAGYTPTAEFLAGVPIAQPAANERIGDFEVLGKLGQGGMGTVYRARQMSLHRLVALKILPAQFEDDEDYLVRFQREAQVAASLTHPNLVRVYAAGVADGCHYIAMELVEGENLRQRLKRGRMSFDEALGICADVARGLQCGWQRAQLIHRDIKPSNIYLAENGEVKLGDLGLAKSLLGNTTGITQTGVAMGTPHYMSPEQARGEKNLDFRADIYSLGCTLYEQLTGQTPYSGTDGVTILHQHLNAPLPAILKVLPQCPIPLVRLVGRMVRKHRTERFQSYDELLEQIESVRAQLDDSAGRSSREPATIGLPEAAVPRVVTTPAAHAAVTKRSRTPLFVSLGGVAMAGIAAVFLWPGNEKPAAPAAAERKPVPLDAPANPASQILPSRQWVAAFPESDPLPGVTETRDGWMLSSAFTVSVKTGGSDLHLENAGIRARMRLSDDRQADATQLVLRRGGPGGGHFELRYYRSLQPGRPNQLQIRHWDNARKSSAMLAGTPIAASLHDAPGGLHLEFYVIGKNLYGRANGGALLTASVPDEAYVRPGALGLAQLKLAYLRDIEVLDLDGLPEAEALQLITSPASGAVNTPRAADHPASAGPH